MHIALTDMKEVEDLLQEFACLESGNTPSSVVPQVSMAGGATVRHSCMLHT